MLKAFLEDIRSHIDFANITGEAGGADGRGGDGDLGEYQEQGEFGRMKATRDWEGDGLGVPLQSSGFVNKSVKSRSYRDTTPAGGAIKACIKNLLPEMVIRLAVIDR